MQHARWWRRQGLLCLLAANLHLASAAQCRGLAADDRTVLTFALLCPFLRPSAHCWCMVCCTTASQLAATKGVQAGEDLMGATLLQAEAAEKERKRKEKAEAHLFTIIKLSTRKDMEQQIGTTLFFDLVDQNKVCVAILIRAAQSA